MGQAKNRGSYAQRLEAAVQRKIQEDRDAQATRERRKAEERAREAALPIEEQIARRQARHKFNMWLAVLAGVTAGADARQRDFLAATRGRREMGGDHG